MKMVEDDRFNKLWLSKFKNFVELVNEEDGYTWVKAHDLGPCSFAHTSRYGIWYFREPNGIWDFTYTANGNSIVFAFEDNHTASLMAVEFKLRGGFILLVEL